MAQRHLAPMPGEQTSIPAGVTAYQRSPGVPALATEDLVCLRETAARVVRSRHRGQDSEDLVQEAWMRVAVALRDREIDDPHAYAAGVAANLVRGRARQDGRRKRRLALLWTHPTVDAPEGGLEREEEAAAVATALSRLPAPARDVLVAHVVWGLDTIRLAREAGTTPGAVAACLARSRAMLRVEYLVAYRHLPEPGDRCRRILYAVSGADTRRATRLGADSHLRTCPSCGPLAESLRERRRPAMAAFVGLRLARWSSKLSNADWLCDGPRVGAAGGLVGVAVVSVLALGGSVAHPPGIAGAVPPEPDVVAAGLAAATPAHLLRASGNSTRVTQTSAPGGASASPRGGGAPVVAGRCPSAASASSSTAPPSTTAPSASSSTQAAPPSTTGPAAASSTQAAPPSTTGPAAASPTPAAPRSATAPAAPRSATAPAASPTPAAPPSTTGPATVSDGPGALRSATMHGAATDGADGPAEGAAPAPTGSADPDRPGDPGLQVSCAPLASPPSTAAPARSDAAPAGLTIAPSPGVGGLLGGFPALGPGPLSRGALSRAGQRVPGDTHVDLRRR